MQLSHWGTSYTLPSLIPNNTTNLQSDYEMYGVQEGK